MHLRFALLMTCMMLGATAANAQFSAILQNISEPLTYGCEAGIPIPDGGVLIEIYWDADANGATPNDVRPTEGICDFCTNINQFQINGEGYQGLAGLFYSDPAFVMESFLPDPGDGEGHPVYWLKVCADNQNTVWQSDTFRLSAGFQDIYFGNGVDEIALNCVSGVCGGCPTPAVVSNAVGSTTYCDSIVVDWDHDGVNAVGYRVRIDGGSFYYISGAGNTRFVDDFSSAGVEHQYNVRSFNVCGVDTVFSAIVSTTGRKLVGPPTPVNMTASDDQCSRVEVNWSVNTILGLDSFRIFRNDVVIGSANRGSAGQVRQFFDNAPLAGVNEYCVRGWSETCDYGDEACNDGSAGLGPQGTITNVAATDDRCDSVIVTFTYSVTDAESFEILRNSISVGSVPAPGGPNYRFAHQPQAGQLGQYQVRAVNDCGSGTAFPATPEPGTRLATPGTVGGIQASDTLCDRVTVVWTDLAAAEQYEVTRNNVTLATVAGDVNTYHDMTAVAGTTYTYRVLALNDCGAGNPTGGNQGTRRAAGTGTAVFTLVTAGPPNWTYSMDVTSGCLDRVKIRDYCEGTTATAPTGWTVTVHGLDSIIFSTPTSVGALDPVVTGFVLSHPTCDGDGRWNVGQSGGSIRGPLPVGANNELPTEFAVKVFPNPFNPTTSFKIALPQAAETKIYVFNVTGQLVKEMALGRMQAGYHTVPFGGNDLASGMYFARIQAGKFHSTHKLMLMK